jgi:hypothetical protein
VAAAQTCSPARKNKDHKHDCHNSGHYPCGGEERKNKNKTPWPEFASEVYRQSDRRLSGMLVPTFCHSYINIQSPQTYIYYLHNQYGPDINPKIVKLKVCTGVINAFFA